MRLIDADELLDVLRKHKGAFALGEGNEPFMEYEVEDYINDCETIDAEPVQHGRWEWITEDVYRCENCGERVHVEEVMGMPVWEHCPDCGAKMDGGAEDE